MAQCMIMRRGGAAASGLPEFTYTGTYLLLDDGHGNWRIRVLTSGTLVFSKLKTSVDVFLVGGGAGASRGNNEVPPPGYGGYTVTTLGITLGISQDYAITIGAGGAAATSDGTQGQQGGSTQAFSYSASGGSYIAGSNGVGEFGDSSATIYAKRGINTASPVTKVPNSGDGGDAKNIVKSTGTPGASGIVVIRNHRAA